MVSTIKEKIKKWWKWILGLAIPVALAAPLFFGNVPQEEQLFAELDSNGIVKRVIVIEQEMLNTGLWGDPTNWVKTSNKGIIRKNYAGRGYKYDKNLDAFIPPKTDPDSILDVNKARWVKPIISNPCQDTATTTCP